MYNERNHENEGRDTAREGNAAGRPTYQRREGASPRPRFNAAGRITPRPRFQREEGGYQPREGYTPREGGYQPREGGYTPRPYQRREGGYQPRQAREGYQPRPYQRREEGGYTPREGYTPRQGGYQPREGYQPNGRSSFHAPHSAQNGYQRQGFRPKYNGKRRIEYSEVAYDPAQPVRLNKLLANAGVCSRRDADKYIEAGVVSVNGEVVTELGRKVLRTDNVMFHGEPVRLEKKVYVLLNKPKGYVTTADDPENRKTVMQLVERACPERIYPVGRLDRNTTGVLLFTNDGDLAAKLTHPQYLKKKIYHVFLDRALTAADLKQIADGITLEDGEIRADDVQYAHATDKKQVGIEIHSGRNRIVRRIFEHLGYKVTKLDRVFFAGLTKKNLRRGDWRFLTEKEVQMLRMGAFE